MALEFGRVGLLATLVMGCSTATTSVDGDDTDMQDVDTDTHTDTETDAIPDPGDPCPNPTVVDEEIVRVNSVADLEALRCVGTITGTLSLEADDLTTLEPLHALRSVGGLEVTRCNRLYSLAGLENLREAEGIRIRSNARMRDLQGLGDVGEVFLFEMTDNPSIETLAGLEGMTGVQWNLTIRAHPRLVSLRGLDNVRFIGTPDQWHGAGLILDELDSLESLDGLGGLRSLQTLLLVSSNPQLARIDALDGLEEFLGEPGSSPSATFTDNRSICDDAIRAFTDRWGGCRCFRNGTC